MAQSILERMKKYSMTGNQNNSLLSNPNQANGGILQNINPDLLLASELIGQGLKGNDPFSSFIPAFTGAAKAKSLMTPKFVKPNLQTFVSKDGTQQKLINTNTPAGLRQAEELAKLGFTVITKGVQAGNASDLQKSSKSSLEKEIKTGYVLAEDLRIMKYSFKPEFLTIAGKAKFKIFKERDRLIPGSLNLQEKQYVSSYGVWDANSNQFFNRYRKEITGVAAGEKEIGYLKTSIPSDSDSPTVYKAKLDNQIKIQDRLNQSAVAYKKIGTKLVYDVKTDADGNKYKEYTPEFLKYVKENKIQPTAAEITNVMNAYKTDKGYDFKSASGFLDMDYKGIDWRNILEKSGIGN